MTLFMFDHRESGAGTHSAERRLAFANKEVPQKYVANQNSGKTLQEQADAVRARMSNVVLRIQKKSNDKEIPEDIRLKYKRLDASIKLANEGLKSRAEASIAEYENTIREVENTIAQLEKDNGIEDKDSYATEMRTKWTNKLLNKDKSVRAETFIWNNRDAFVLYVPDDWVIGMDLPEGNVNDVSESRTSYMFFKKDLPANGVLPIDIPGKGTVYAAFALVADQTDGSRKDLKIDLSGTSSAEAIPAPTTLEDETPSSQSVATAAPGSAAPMRTNAARSAYDENVAAQFRSMRPANSGAAYSNSGAASESYPTQPQQRPMSAEEIRKHNIRVAYHPNNRHNPEAVRRIMKSKTPVTPLGDEGIIENTVPKDKWWKAPYSMNPNNRVLYTTRGVSDPNRAPSPEVSYRTEEGRRLQEFYSPDVMDARIAAQMRAAGMGVGPNVSNPFQNVSNSAESRVRALHKENFLIPGMQGSLNDGRSGSALRIKIEVPPEISGIQGMTQITYYPGSGRFRTDTEQAMARRAGIYFQNGGDELDVLFAKEGKFAIWSEAGDYERGRGFNKMHARRDINVTVRDYELRKYAEAQKNPPDTWNVIPSGNPGFRYLMTAKGTLFAHHPKTGMHFLDKEKAQWFRVEPQNNAVVSAKPAPVADPDLTETPSANPAVVSETQSAVTAKSPTPSNAAPVAPITAAPELKNAVAIKKTFADFSAKNGVKVTYSNEIVGTPDMDAIDATLVKLEAALQTLDPDMKKDLGTSFTIYLQSSASDSQYDGTSFYIRSSDSVEEMEEILEAGLHPKAPKFPKKSVAPIMGSISTDAPRPSQVIEGPATGNSMPKIDVPNPFESGKTQAQTIGKEKVLVSHNDNNVDTQRLVIFNMDHPAYDAILKANKDLFLTDDIKFNKNGRSITMSMSEWKKVGGNEDGSWTGNVLPPELREKTDYAEIAMKEATSLSKRIRPIMARAENDPITFENVSKPNKPAGEFEGMREIKIKVSKANKENKDLPAKSIELPFLINTETMKITPMQKMPAGIELMLDRKEYTKDQLAIALRGIQWENLTELN